MITNFADQQFECHGNKKREAKIIFSSLTQINLLDSVYVSRIFSPKKGATLIRFIFSF